MFVQKGCFLVLIIYLAPKVSNLSCSMKTLDIVVIVFPLSKHKHDVRTTINCQRYTRQISSSLCNTNVMLLQVHASELVTLGAAHLVRALGLLLHAIAT